MYIIRVMRRLGLAPDPFEIFPVAITAEGDWKETAAETRSCQTFRLERAWVTPHQRITPTRSGWTGMPGVPGDPGGGNASMNQYQLLSLEEETL